MDSPSKKKMYALIQWEDLFFDVLCTTRIEDPRKALDSYSPGEYIKAKYKGKTYSAIICELSSERSILMPKAKDPTYSQSTKYAYVAGQSNVKQLESQDASQAQVNSTLILIDQGSNKPATTCTLPLPARPVKRKIEPTNELKQVKAQDTKAKRVKTSEREAASASFVTILDHDTNNSMDVVMDMLKKIETKGKTEILPSASFFNVQEPSPKH